MTGFAGMETLWQAILLFMKLVIFLILSKNWNFKNQRISTPHAPNH
jgi:hypothetical protein